MSRDVVDSATHVRAAADARDKSFPFALEVVEGPDVGVRHEILPDHPLRVLLGKSESCELRLSDASVSRRHAALEVVGDRLRITDLGSTNGTVVDGTAVVAAYLVGGELVRCGDSVIRVHRGDRRHVVIDRTQERFGSMIGASDAMQRLYPLCKRLAESDVPVVIEGETGVGKEQLAESLHAASPRSSGPFVVFDCTAVAPSLIESELFGHEAGAFTGAVARHRGVFERAEEGTLLIDEIGDLPIELQAKLLRVIERRRVTRVGGDEPIGVDVRLLAATRRDLDREVQHGRFRDDLFHRIAVARIELPSLRERVGDVSMLARHFWTQMGGNEAGPDPRLLRHWEDYDWPGNVRELRNAVARRLALGEECELLHDELALAGPGNGGAGVHSVTRRGDTIRAVLALELPLADARQRVTREFEQRYVEALLEAHDGNVTRAAAAAGVTRRQFQRLKSRSEGA